MTLLLLYIQGRLLRGFSDLVITRVGNSGFSRQRYGDFSGKAGTSRRSRGRMGLGGVNRVNIKVLGRT